MKNPTGHVARWIERLAPFGWKIVHRPGRQHGNADALSRRVCPGDCVQCMKIFPTHDDKLTQERKLLEELEEELITINKGRKGDPLTKNPRLTRHQQRVQRDFEVLKTFQGMWDREELLLAVSKDPILSKVLSSHQWKLLIPKAYQNKVLQMLHNDPTSGHFGETGSVALMKMAPIYWFGCFQHMQLHCRCCDDCFCSKPPNRHYKAP